MTNIPENENLNTAENTEEILKEDGFSTVFSNPAEHKKTAEDFKKKRLLPKILASFLAVAILAGGTFAVIKFIPEKVDENATSSTPILKEIEVLNLDSNELKEILVYNNAGTFRLYSSKVDSEKSWYVHGYAEGILSTASIGDIATSLASISAAREITELTAADCGLVNARLKAIIIGNDGKQTTVLIGNESPDKSGYYLMLQGSDKIYVVDTSLKAALDFNPLNLANATALSAFPADKVSSSYKAGDGLLNSFDKLTISGANIKEPLVIIPITEEDVSGASTYKIISPTRRVASSENLSTLVQLFQSGIEVSGAYSLDISQKTLQSLGLSNPDFVAQMEIENETHTFKFKLQADGSYAAISDDSLIVKKVDAASLPFADKQSSYFYSDWVAINSIDDLKAFTFEADGKSHKFEIAVNSDANAVEKYAITYAGRAVDVSAFQSFYADCISVKSSDFTADKVSGKPKYRIIFTYNDEKGGSEIVEFTKFSETKYQFTVNGDALGKVTAAALKSLENSLNNLIENK